VIENGDHTKREADLERHLSSEPGNGSGLFVSEVSATDDYMMYQALMMLKAASILSAR